jgi:hypothetical protein
MKTRLKTHLWVMEMTQRELSRKSGVNETAVSFAANLGIANDRTKQKIAEALGVDQNELFNKEG